MAIMLFSNESYLYKTNVTVPRLIDQRCIYNVGRIL